MSSGIPWPNLVRLEYAHFDKTGTGLNAAKFNRVFRFREGLISEYPPCFFAGDLRKSRFCLLGLNPGHNRKRKDVECRVYRERGWEQTYLAFFDWFGAEQIPSPYYSRIAVLLSGLLREKEIPKERKRRFQLLSENLINLDLIPYHSSGISLRIETREQRELIKPYLVTLIELVELCKPQILIINGAAFRPILKQTGFKERSTIKVNERLNAHIGQCLNSKTVWFDRFITGQSAAVTNRELHSAGKRIKETIS